MGENSGNNLVLTTRRVGGAAVVEIRGSAGIAEAERLKAGLEGLVEQKLTPIILDLRGMEFICSAGLGAIITAYVRSRHHRGQIRLVGPQPAVLRILETTRLTRLFSVYPGVDQALGAG